MTLIDGLPAAAYLDECVKTAKEAKEKHGLAFFVKAHTLCEQLAEAAQAAADAIRTEQGWPERSEA